MRKALLRRPHCRLTNCIGRYVPIKLANKTRAHRCDRCEDVVDESFQPLAVSDQDILVARLRELGSLSSTAPISADLNVHAILHEAADKILSLQGHLDLAKAAIDPFANVASIPLKRQRTGTEIGDERIVSVEMPLAPHERTPGDRGETPVALVISLDGLTVGDFRRARAFKHGPDL